MGISKNSATSRELIEIGSLDVLGTLEAEVMIAKVVGENDNYIWLVFGVMYFRQERDWCHQQEGQDASFHVWHSSIARS